MGISNEKVKKGLITLNMIWVAMLLSLAMYLFLSIQMAGKIQTTMDADTFFAVRSALYVYAFVILVFMRFLKNLLLSAKGGTNQTSRSDGNAVSHPALGKYTTAMMITWAISESIGICGIVLFFLGKNVVDLYLLIAVSAAAILINRPNGEEIVALSQDGFETAAGPVASRG